MEKNKKKNKINKKLEYLLLSCFCLWGFFSLKSGLVFLLCAVFPKGLKIPLFTAKDVLWYLTHSRGF